jgi:hypothetical protein
MLRYYKLNRALLSALIAVLLLGSLAATAGAQARKIKVLLSTGDWKTQPWYQDVVMKTKDGKPSIYRGRYIIQEVEKAAPGRFEFTDVPNYIAQEYIDPAYLSQFDVMLLGDIMPHFPLAWQKAVNRFVSDGGGLIYCANHKWGVGVKHRGEPLEDCLPSLWPTPDEKGHYSSQTGDVNFLPLVSAASHPAIQGLDWPSAPPLHYNFNAPVRKEATVLLTSPAITARTWLISPTYPVAKPQPGKPPPEMPLPAIGNLSQWKETRFDRSGRLDLLADRAYVEWVGVWALTYVKSQAARTATILANGDDTAIVYLNGRRVVNQDGNPSSNTNGKVQLRAGWNTVLLRCDQYTGGWSFDFDIQDERGRTLRDLIFAPAPSDSFKPPLLEHKPVLSAWDYGKGRAMFSTAIFSNDESSERFGNEWKDFGRFYAQVFAWLGEHSRNTKTALRDASAEVNVTVNFTKPLNPVSPGIFSIHGNEGITGEALTNYMALNPRGTFYRHGVDYERDRPDGAGVDSFNYAAAKADIDNVDKSFAEARSLGVEMIAGFHGITYGSPQWLWQDNPWEKCNDRQAAEVAKMFAAVVEHVNHGKKGDASYRPNLKYVELGNEPTLDDTNLAGYAKIAAAVGRRIHRDYPGVKLVVYCQGLDWRYVEQLIDAVGPYVDAFSLHPYGWTSDVLFPHLQRIEDYYTAKVGRPVELMITEWDFWIQGRQKFDYMMRRNFSAVQLPHLTCALHYRLWQYNEPIYLFGVLWAGWGLGEGKKGQPMHDAYDAFWIWKDFRGCRVESTIKLVGNEPSEKLLPHLHVDASRSDAALNTVLYYDWAYGGTGFKDYARGLNYPKVKANLRLMLPPGFQGKKLTIAQAGGEGFSDLATGITIAGGQRQYIGVIQLAPLTGISVTVK